MNVWDVDLLVGRDTTTGVRVGVRELSDWMSQAGLSSGVLGSLRAIQFDAASGNAECATVAGELGLVPSLTLETRDWLSSRRALLDATPGTVVRLAPQRQDCQPGFPGFRAIVDLVAARSVELSAPDRGGSPRPGLLVLAEGDIRVWGPAYAGRGLRVVFLDTHFYHLGDFVALAAEESGFATSTRLLNGPDSLDIVRAELGIDRLLLGTRAGLHEGRSALERVRTAGLSEAEQAAVLGGTLRRLLGRERDRETDGQDGAQGQGPEHGQDGGHR